MDIRNQIRLGLLISLIFAIIISVSIVLSYQNMRDIQIQEDLAADVVRGSYELTYLSNDYLINAEPRARLQWEERYASLQPIISQLKPGTAQEVQSLAIIRDYNEKIGSLFREISEPNALSTGTVLFPARYQQAMWSRINVQSQGLIYEAWRLRHLYNDDVSEARFWNNILILILMAAMLVIISINYLLISRRLVRSIREVNSGSEQFATGNLDYRIPVTSDDEIGGIARRLNTMAEQIRRVTASRDELEREKRERGHAQAALFESEARYREFFTTSRDAVFITTPEGEWIDFNDTALEMFGYAGRNELMALPLPHLYEHPEQRNDLLARIEREGFVREFLARLRKRDGTIIDTLITAVPLKKPEGSVRAFIGSIRDITAQNEAEERIKTSEMRYRRLFESAKDGILILNLDTGAILDANPFIETLLGYGPKDLIGKHLWEIGLFKDQVLSKIAFKELQEKAYVRYEDLPLETKDGRGIDVEFVSNVYPLDSRTSVIQCNIRDITERKRSEVALRETNEYLRNLLDYANAPIIVWDPQFRITRFNHAFEHLTGRTEQEVLGKNLEILFPSKTRETSLQRIQKTLAGERWESVEIPILHISGEIRTVLWNSANIVDPEGRIISTIAQGQDITDRKMIEIQRELLVRELEQKNAELERFTYTVSHDLKSPLITIRGFAGMIEQDVQKGDFLQLKKDLHRINAAADTMQELLNDVLELSRIGRIISPPEKIPFSVIVREAADLLAGQISERGVTLEIAPDLPEVNVDRARIREVLVNLLENAVKFSDNRSDPVIRVGVDRTGEIPVFFVQDNGIGIEPNYIGRIFNLFEKLDPSYPGTGVGLTIVKRIIEVHGGKIWAESGGWGKGTTFRFTLPVIDHRDTDKNKNG